MYFGEVEPNFNLDETKQTCSLKCVTEKGTIKYCNYTHIWPRIWQYQISNLISQDIITEVADKASDWLEVKLEHGKGVWGYHCDWTQT